MKYETGYCRICNKKKEDHASLGGLENHFCESMEWDGPTFEDSGIAKVHEHCLELLEKAEALVAVTDKFTNGNGFTSNSKAYSELKEAIVKCKAKG